MANDGNFGFITPCSPPSGGQASIALNLKRCKHLVTGRELEMLVLILIVPEKKVNVAILPLALLPKSSDNVVWTWVYA